MLRHTRVRLRTLAVTALAVEIFEQVCTELGLGSTRPASLRVGPVPGEKGAFLAVPSLERSQAHVPVSRMDLPGTGPCIVFHFNKAQFSQIEAAKRTAASR